MLAIFYANGTWPEVNNMFSSKHGESAISAAHSFMARGKRVSGPGDLFGLSSEYVTNLIGVTIDINFDDFKSTILSYSGKLA